jgi:hypothetical protein
METERYGIKYDINQQLINHELVDRMTLLNLPVTIPVALYKIQLVNLTSSM